MLNDISLVINRGEVMCFLGANGSGKTTLMNILAGFTNPDEGDVYVRDTSGERLVSLLFNKNEFRKLARVCQQNDYLFEELTI